MRFIALRRFLLPLALLGLVRAGLAQEPTPIRAPDAALLQVQQTLQAPLPEPQPLNQGPDNVGNLLRAPSDEANGKYTGQENTPNKLSGTPSTPNSTNGAPEGPRAPDASPSSTTNSITGAGGAASSASNAPDVADLLTKSTASTGIDIQRRNGIVADTRIRGLRNTEIGTTADYGAYLPSRLDLDSVASRFDAGDIRDVTVIKGPYSALYGPGFAFLDIGTFDSPRYDGQEFHGRTSLTYQSNGQRWDAVQSLLVGDKDYGFRVTYNYLQGGDYTSGNGTRVGSSYLSNNVNFALGVDLTDISKIEFKGLVVQQNNLEFPGLYFDIRNLSTEAYSLRYTLINQYWFDKLTLDVWYNGTAAQGNTALETKQSFVQKLLQVSFNAPGSTLNNFTDNSSTNFAGRSIGYRFATSWGPLDAPLLTVGTDLNVFGQGLNEYINFTQTSGVNINTGQTITNPANFTQNQGIPPSQSVNPGLFVQGELKATDDLKIKAGGRYDYVATGSDPRLIYGNVNLFGPPQNLAGPNSFVLDPIIYSSNPNNPALSRQFNLGSGFLSGDYAVTEKITGMLSFGYAMRAPTLTELYASGPFIGVLQQGTSRLIGDPNLKPEKLAQIDIGLRADYETWQAGINGYYSVINDYITYDANRLGQGLTQVVYTNTNRATLAGTELFAQFNATSWLTPFGTLSYVQGFDETPTDNRRAANLASSRRDELLQGQTVPQSEPLPQIPPLEARLGIRIHAPTAQPRWQIEFNARLVAAQNNVATSLGEVPTPAFAVFDIRTFYRVNDHWLLTFGVENIGNLNYLEHLDFNSGNTLGVDPNYRPGTNFYFGSQLTY